MIETKKKIYDQLLKGKLKEGFQIFLKNPDPRHKKEISLLHAQHSQNEKSFHLGIINSDDYNTIKNKILYSLLNFLDLTESEKNAIYELDDSEETYNSQRNPNFGKPNIKSHNSLLKNTLIIPAGKLNLNTSLHESKYERVTDILSTDVEGISYLITNIERYGMCRIWNSNNGELIQYLNKGVKISKPNIFNNTTLWVVENDDLLARYELDLDNNTGVKWIRNELYSFNISDQAKCKIKISNFTISYTGSWIYLLCTEIDTAKTRVFAVEVYMHKVIEKYNNSKITIDGIKLLANDILAVISKQDNLILINEISIAGSDIFMMPYEGEIIILNNESHSWNEKLSYSGYRLNYSGDAIVKSNYRKEGDSVASYFKDLLIGNVNSLFANYSETDLVFFSESSNNLIGVINPLCSDRKFAKRYRMKIINANGKKVTKIKWEGYIDNPHWTDNKIAKFRLGWINMDMDTGYSNKFLMLSSIDGLLSIWNINTKELLATFQDIHTTRPVFTAKGKRLFYADRFGFVYGFDFFT